MSLIFWKSLNYANKWFNMEVVIVTKQIERIVEFLRNNVYLNLKLNEHDNKNPEHLLTKFLVIPYNWMTPNLKAGKNLLTTRSSLYIGKTSTLHS